MNKIAILILAGSESHVDTGRAVNALQIALEAKEAGDTVDIIFDGAGTTWIPKFTDTESQFYPLYEQVKDKVAGACYFCSKAFGVFKEVKESGVTMLKDYKDHPSIRNYYNNGYQVLTF